MSGYSNFQRAWTKSIGLGADGWKATGDRAGGGVPAGGPRKHDATGWRRYIFTARKRTTIVVYFC